MGVRKGVVFVSGVCFCSLHGNGDNDLEEGMWFLFYVSRKDLLYLMTRISCFFLQSDKG